MTTEGNDNGDQMQEHSTAQHWWMCGSFVAKTFLLTTEPKKIFMLCLVPLQATAIIHVMHHGTVLCVCAVPYSAVTEHEG